jgi:branched-chain amino acid transport system ATP-binding protein
MIDRLLEVDGLDARYGPAQILFNLSFYVARGEVVALMGRNGAGKSTTLKAVMGMLEGTHGAVRFMGESILGEPSFRIAQRGVGYVPEDRRVFTDLTVAENLDIGRQPARSWPDGSPLPLWTEQKICKLFPNLAEMLTRRGGQMSGGEQQMLTVARTLMGNPYLMLLDEPSAGIAPIIVDEMATMIRELKAEGVSVLLSEQNAHFAEALSDRVYVLEKGQIQFAGSMAEFRHDQPSL